MKKIYDEFLAMSALQRFAVLSNILSVVSVSAATITIGPLLSKISGVDFVVEDLVILIAVCLVVAVSNIVILWRLCANMLWARRCKNHKSLYSNGAGLIIFICATPYFSPFIVLYTGFLFNNSYILPDVAENAVVYVDVGRQATRYKDDGVYSLYVNVSGNGYRVNYSNYCLVVYERRDGGQGFTLRMHGKNTCIDFSMQGYAYINAINLEKIDSRNEVALAVVRKVDKSILSFIGGVPFPPSLDVINETSLPRAKIYWVRNSDLVRSVGESD